MDDNKFKVAIDNNVYSKESIVAACYKFTDKYYVYQQTSSTHDNVVDVIFEGKENDVVDEHVIKRFFNELIDQQVRYNMNQRFGHIRDLIVEEAFKPISK